jgi:hypothetical protein
VTGPWGAGAAATAATTAGARAGAVSVGATMATADEEAGLLAHAVMHKSAATETAPAYRILPRTNDQRPADRSVKRLSRHHPRQ